VIGAKPAVQQKAGHCPAFFMRDIRRLAQVLARTAARESRLHMPFLHTQKTGH
jgi:hypothetical protein